MVIDLCAYELELFPNNKSDNLFHHFVTLDHFIKLKTEHDIRPVLKLCHLNMRPQLYAIYESLSQLGFTIF